MRRAPDDGSVPFRDDADMTRIRHQRDESAAQLSRLIELGRDREAAALGAASPHHQSEGERMDPLDQLDQVGPLLAKVVGNIRPAQLDNPTPCAHFTVRGVLDHMIGGATAFAAAFRGQPAPTGAPPAEVLDAFGPALTNLATAMHEPGALDRTVEAPFGAMPGENFARLVVLDGLVHGWDLATATEQPYDPPGELVAEVTAFATDALDPLRDGDTFAAAVTPPNGSTPIEQLVSLTGRSLAGGTR
jgi:uncharacterized protein (TIGR03086 family)